MDMEGGNGKGRRTRAFCAVRSRLPAYKRGPPAAIDTGGVTQTGTGEVGARLLHREIRAVDGSDRTRVYSDDDVPQIRNESAFQKLLAD